MSITRKRPRIPPGPFNFPMSTRNASDRKTKKQSEKRALAAGHGYLHANRKVTRKVVELTTKQENQQKIADDRSRKERKARVGKPQPSYLGNRTRTESGRQGYGKLPNRLYHVYDWVDTAAGTKTISEFSGESNRIHFTLIVRILLSENFMFYTDTWRWYILKYFIHRFRFLPTETLTSTKMRLLRILSTKEEAERIIERFGPGFFPRGQIIDNNVVVQLHSIPIKDNSLFAAQNRFAEKNEENVVSLYQLDLARYSTRQTLLRGGADAPKVTFETKKPEGPKSSSSEPSKEEKKKEKPQYTDAQKAEYHANLAKRIAGNKGQKGTTTTTVQTPSPTESAAATEKDKVDEFLRFKEQFVFRKTLDGVKTHKAADLNQSEYLDSLQPVECRGNPFCGYVSIDLCCGTAPDFDKFVRFAKNQGFLEPYAAGNSETLDLYCNTMRGFNLMIFTAREIVNGSPADLDDSFVDSFLDTPGAALIYSEKYICAYRTVIPDNNAPWVCLLHQAGGVGHFVPLIGPKKQELMPLPRPLPTVTKCVIYDITEEYSKIHTLVDPSGDDRRCPNLRREKIEIIDTYSSVQCCKLSLIHI